MPTRSALALLLLVLGVLGTAAGHADDTPAARAAAPEADRRPNVLLVMTDDMAATDLKWMPRTRRLVGRAGTTFDQGLAPNPMCCPARATVLTGQESHNNGVWSNTQPHGGYASLPPGPRLPDWLQDAGYRTAFLGKHLNGFNAPEAARETGWDVLDALVRGVYAYRTFVTWDDGDLRAVRGGYVTDHLGDATRRVIRRFERRDDTPWFTWVAHVGPHTSRPMRCPGTRCWGPPRPADRDLGEFDGLSSPSRSAPSWNHRNDETKPPFLRDLDRKAARQVDTLFQRRVESLQSVDRSVAAIVRELRRRDELDDTVLVFTSDHGYLLGQHRYVGKRLPYEESLRVPLLVRGPGVQAGAHTDQLTTTADLSRTIVELAGAEPSYELDGVSMLPALRGAGEAQRTSTLLQTGASVYDEGDGSDLGEEPAERGWLYRGYRDERWTYARYPEPAGAGTPAFEELYDRSRDRHQLHNLAQDPAYAGVLAEAQRRASELAACAGDACHPGWGPIPAP